MNGLWKTSGVPVDDANRMAAACGVPLRVARWLCARGIPVDTAETWLRPESAAWMAPDVFCDMPAAVERILASARRNELVAVIGDYDVDGVTATAILATALQRLGVSHVCLIPHRTEDGYGLSNVLVDRARAAGAQLLVTVDNGIRADDAIRYATDLGLDVIVTDHHEPGDERPSGAVAVVHWAYAGGHGDARTLSGAGVAWKVAQALLSAADLWDAAELEDWLVGLAALGAIADMMPMSVENRKLVSTGLAALRRCRRAGWLALCQSAGLDTADITPIKVAFTIAPRLNAAGRMGTASVALELLMAEDEVEAAARAAQIETWNQLRKAETERAYQEAYAQYTQMHPADDAPVVLVAGPWHLGVAGIVAARLVNQVQKPAVVLCGDGEGMWRGSGRATTGFDLHQVVSQCSAHLAHFGGHEAAIGCAVHPHLLDAFRADLYHAASAWVGGASEADKPVADDYLPLAEANLEMLGWVERFAPHGPDNPPLTFYVGPVKLVRVTEMAGGRHARLRVREGRHEADLVWFRVPEEVLSWPSGTAFAAVVEMERNTWQGRTTAQLRVLDGRLLKHPWLREELALLYRLLRARRKLTIHEVAESVPKRTPSEIQVALDTFAELGFAEASESAYHVVESVVQRDLRDSVHYQSHLRRCAEALSL